LQWGFLHLSRFAAGYHARFGEKPSETLRRASTDSATKYLIESA
jgi:hypothetical protein